MSAEPNNTGSVFVTWKALSAVLFSLASVLCSLGWVVWQAHAQQPHHNAVEIQAFRSWVESIDRRLNRIEDKLDSVIKHNGRSTSNLGIGMDK